MVQIKRVYDPPASTDGRRVLVDRLWPRGLSKEAAHVDEWLRDLAPSDELRRWFGHEASRFAEFRTRYLDELAREPVRSQLAALARRVARGKVTLLFGAKDIEHNNAVVLAEQLARHRRVGRAQAEPRRAVRTGARSGSASRSAGARSSRSTSPRSPRRAAQRRA